MRLNDKQTLLTIKALSHYINDSLQYVSNDDVEKINARYLLQTMEDNLLGNFTKIEFTQNDINLAFGEIESEKIKDKLSQGYKPISLWRLAPLSIEACVIFTTLAEHEDIVHIKFETDGKIVFASLVASEDCVCAAHDIDDVLKIVRSGNNLQFEQKTPNGHVWHEFELLDHQLYSLLENNVIYDIVLD